MAPRTRRGPGTSASRASSNVAGHEIIVIGASAGGVEALSTLVSGLPAGLPAAVLVVVHIPANATSVLPAILSRSGPLPAAHAVDGELVVPGRIYVAPTDHHLMLRRGRVEVVRGPRENATRPAVDPLFRSAARAYGRRVVGVVLSGMLDDGTVGLGVVKSCGGLAVVQDPADAVYPSMPSSAIENVRVDHVVPLSRIASLLVELVAQEPAGAAPGMSAEEEVEVSIDEMDEGAHAAYDRPGVLSSLTCPECHGSLWEVGDDDALHFRCRVGHAYSPQTLYSEQAEAVEAAVWAALQVLEERALLAARMAERMERRGQAAIAQRFADQASEAKAHAAVLRRVLVRGDLGEPVLPAGRGFPAE
ncbi:MAG: chemotaxis protein CheB [Gemmatimonadetes bacterium]|nr:chemotaxis protein CheB [Gemmatimonadota bacterium]